MDVFNRYGLWLENTIDDHDTQNQLKAMAEDSELITDAFYKDLSFGTGGLRGLLGTGTNRMNIYTVGGATQGVADYIKSNVAFGVAAIAYDTRNMSKEFAHHAASVLAANGIKVYLTKNVAPTPMLSYYVRELRADIGIVITASHNPKEYNGYKVYGSNGGQVTEDTAKAILKNINSTDIFSEVKTIAFEAGLSNGSIVYIDPSYDNSYYEKVVGLIMDKPTAKTNGNKLNILYTPIHGTGFIPVTTALNMAGFSNVTVVEDQTSFDGNFPTVVYPNPEEPEVFNLALDVAKTINPDIIIATDPDCDRVAVMVGTGSDYKLLTGNQVGALLTQYLLEARKSIGTLPNNAAIIKTIVTGDLPKKITDDYCTVLYDTLTGFKYIGELVDSWDISKEKAFILGFEESIGYLAGDFVRDKDAVIASVLIAEMALYYKLKGENLCRVLDKLYQRYGFYINTQVSAEAKGSDGQQKIAATMEHFRTTFREILAELDIAVVQDYKESTSLSLVDNSTVSIELPKADVFKIIFSDGSWIVLRPSGTEPKIKLYYQAVGKDEPTAKARLKQLEAAMSVIKL